MDNNTFIGLCEYESARGLCGGKERDPNPVDYSFFLATNSQHRVCHEHAHALLKRMAKEDEYEADELRKAWKAIRKNMRQFSVESAYYERSRRNANLLSIEDASRRFLNEVSTRRVQKRRPSRANPFLERLRTSMMSIRASRMVELSNVSLADVPFVAGQRGGEHPLAIQRAPPAQEATNTFDGMRADLSAAIEKDTAQPAVHRMIPNPSGYRISEGGDELIDLDGDTDMPMATFTTEN